MNNALRSAIRKHALANNVSTIGWSDTEFAGYGVANNISAVDNLRNNTALKIEAEVIEAPVAPKLEVVPATGGAVEAAIQALIAATAPPVAPIDEKAVISLIEKHSRKVVVEINNHETKEVTRVEGAHKMFPVVMQIIAAGVNVAVVGPAGSGKSTIFEQCANALNLDYYFTGAVQQEHKIMGFIDAAGHYHRTQFREAFENGGVFVMEEFDGSSARALLAINNAVANEWCDFPDGKVKKHPNFVCVMAGNTYGTGASRQYVGRQQLDAATLDRFAFVEVGYDEDLEVAVTLAHNENAGAWVKKVQAFRRKVEAAGLRHVVSPRASIMGAKLLKGGMDEQTAAAVLLHKGLTTDQLNQIK